MSWRQEVWATLIEIGRVLLISPRIEVERRRVGIHALLTKARLRARQAPSRDELSRRCLRRAILWVDAWFPGGRNCYRRALIEITLDRDGVKLPLTMGFKHENGVLRGHAWLPYEDCPPSDYEFIVVA